MFKVPRAQLSLLFIPDNNNKYMHIYCGDTFSDLKEMNYFYFQWPGLSIHSAESHTVTHNENNYGMGGKHMAWR